MQELIPIQYDGDQIMVSARDLHEFLEVGTDYRHWFPRMCEYGFTEGQDFNPVKIDRVQQEGERMVTRIVEDAALSMDMAKEICMLQRNEKGKIARQYFIQLEKDWNSPEKIMARALTIAKRELKQLKADKASLQVDLAIAQPKADYFDDLVDSENLLSFRETAKVLNISEKAFLSELLGKHYLYRDQKGRLLPTAKKNHGLFSVKESKNDKTGWVGTQTLITVKGREHFRRLFLPGVM